MKKIQVSVDALPGQPAHSHLEEVVDYLLACGNSLAHEYRWGSNREGYFCHFHKLIDFDILEAHFNFPPTIHLVRARGLIYCEKTGCIISLGA
jgi:hypothetical protein